MSERTLQERLRGKAAESAISSHRSRLLVEAADALAVLEAENRALLDVADVEAERDAALRLLRRLSEWDHMDTAGDGAYWRQEIDAFLARHAEEKP